MEFLLTLIYVLIAFYFGSLLDSMSKRKSHRTTERVKMGFWSGFWYSSTIFVPLTFLIAEIIN